MELNYGWEKLFSACHYAVGSSETPQKRLAAVVADNIMYLRRENLPSDEAWSRVQKIMHATTCKQAHGSEGTIAATTCQMTDDEAGKWLSEIMSLFADLAEEYGRRQAALSTT
jgi:hypothetical protein